MAYGDLNYTTQEINDDLEKVHDKEALVEEAPSDGKQYGRKNNEWSVIEAGGTQYLDLSMFSSESGTLSDEDYQKVVKAYEDGVTTCLYEENLFIPMLIMGMEGSFSINIQLLNTGANVIYQSVIVFFLNNDKSYEKDELPIIFDQSGSGTKALTDNGKYAEFAKPTKVESGGSGSVTKQLNPNTFYEFGKCSSLTITLASETSGIANEYMFEFVSGSTPATLSLPDSVKWSGGNAPTIEANKTYQVSIVNNLAVFAAF